MDIEQIIEEAKEKACKDGYDQVIYKANNKKIMYARSSSRKSLSSRKILGYVRLFYKDGDLRAVFKDY